ncbi:hypothetical protein BDV96DRAFT_9500 [Lophiotrema nucula]|uniref:Uncharacterized protein n=1 Tax=Lophiotrema nucula TaxID=690887 RepID=A0A6A5ZVF6_9PLEO|nr:hypothetical protein BDV96DRAFT_9500 [Lophiotrema nucula]
MKTAIIATLIALAAARPYVTRANLQTFTGALGGIAATPVEDSGNPDRPFQVKGDTFVNIAAAFQRSCDQQFNACANAANGGDKTLSVSACSDQQTQCNAAAQSANTANTGNAANNAGNASQAAAAATTTAAANPCAGVVATATATPTPTAAAAAASVNPCAKKMKRRAGNKA